MHATNNELLDTALLKKLMERRPEKRVRSALANADIIRLDFKPIGKLPGGRATNETGASRGVPMRGGATAWTEVGAELVASFCRTNEPSGSAGDGHILTREVGSDPEHRAAPALAVKAVASDNAAARLARRGDSDSTA